MGDWKEDVAEITTIALFKVLVVLLISSVLLEIGIAFDLTF